MEGSGRPPERIPAAARLSVDAARPRGPAAGPLGPAAAAAWYELTEIQISSPDGLFLQPHTALISDGIKRFSVVSTKCQGFYEMEK